MEKTNYEQKSKVSLYVSKSYPSGDINSATGIPDDEWKRTHCIEVEVSVETAKKILSSATEIIGMD